MTEILKAKPVVKHLNDLFKQQMQELGFAPCMVVLAANQDPASQYYVSSIVKRGLKLGAKVEVRNMPPDTKEAAFIQQIHSLNQDKTVHGIMIQKPLPKGWNDAVVTAALNPAKDLDGLHPANLGALVADTDGFVPCTPAAVMEMLDFYKVDVAGRRVVVVGRSAIVGKPLANLLLRKTSPGNATVTVCHSRSNNLAQVCQQAEVLIAAVGKAGVITADMITPGVTLIDVGVNAVQNTEGETVYVGDIDYEACLPLAKAITPVPGGVGSVTTAMLFTNLAKAARYNS